MKTAKLFLLSQLFLLLQVTLSAQVQWFQNQNGNNQPPNGTYASCVKNFNSNSFAACYLWHIEGETFTWKISKTNFNGAEQKTFYVTGDNSNVEIRVGTSNTLFILQKNYPTGLNPEYKLYKLDEQLHVKAQKTISFPNGYIVYNMNCFEVDEDNNVYLAGDGQHPVENPLEGFAPASFVMKTNKNLATQWNKMNYTQTSYTRLHVDNAGKVTVIEDYYTFFPDIHVKKFNSSGQLVQSKTLTTDAGRYSLYSSLDGDDNLLIYGGKSIGDTVQGMYLYKISKTNGSVLYERTHFVAPGSQLNDLKVDNQGRIFALATLYLPGDQQSRICRINPNNGNISWNHSLSYSQDSCNLIKLAIGNEGLYAIGQRNSNDFFAKGFAVRMKKNGQCEGNIAGPDSVQYERVHWLSEGIVDNERLISIGGTYAFNTETYEMSDVRAFAVKFGSNNNCGRPGSEEGAEASVASTERDGDTNTETKLVIYPNPVQDKLTVSNLQEGGYDNIAIYTMQGSLVMKQVSASNAVKIDISTLSNGVYLLVLRSSATLKEKSLKFVVKK